MKINKAIRNLMKQKNVTLAMMGNSLYKVDKKTGETIHLKSNDVSARLVSENLLLDKVLEMLDVLGYELVIQEKKRGSRRVDQIVIDHSDEEE